MGHNFGFARWIWLRFCQFRVLISKNGLVQALVPGKFFKGGKWLGQGRGLGAKIAFSRSFENAKFCLDVPNPEGYVYFFGPAGGRSLRARVFVWQGCGLWRRFFLCIEETYKQPFPRRGLEGKFWFVSSLPSPSVYFPALPGAARCAFASSYDRDMTCRDGLGSHRLSNIVVPGASKPKKC